MDCYFHAHVPSVARCADCRRPICATCRDTEGTCPSCRLGARIDEATASPDRLSGSVPTAPRAAPMATVTTPDPVESRILVALGYPLWPIALLALFDRKRSPALRRQTYQGLAFNLAFYALWGIFSLLASLPWLGIEPALLLPFLIPLFLASSVYYAYKVWIGEEARVPIISDWLEERLPSHS